MKCLRADDEHFLRVSYSTKSKSKYGCERPNFLSLLLFKASSETSDTSYLSINEGRNATEHAKIIAQQAEKRTKRKLDLLERSFELEKQNISDEEFEAKNNADLLALDIKIDELNRSKFESNCEKDLVNIEQKHLEKHNSLEGNTWKLKEKLTISDNHLTSTFKESVV